MLAPQTQNQIFDDLSCQYQTVGRFAAEISTSTIKSVTVVHVNIVSLHKNYDTLKLFLSEFSKPVEVICLRDSRLNDRNLKHCSIPGYMYCYNSATRAGGAAIFIREELQCQQLSAIKIKADGCEDVRVELKINNNESLVVGSVYRHPSRGDPGPLGHIYRWDIAFTRIVVKIRNQIFEIATPMAQLSFQP